MAYEINEAKALVVEAGKKLVESGLIARTWGNVSARISDTQFVITPSGRAYETLTPDEIVVVNIDDCEYEGDIKPSSEKGIHADAYRLRDDVNFVIHTHQVNASVISCVTYGINNVSKKEAEIIGPVVPSAAYGMPSTGKLRDGVASAVACYPEAKSFVMQHHGALCLGADFDEAFLVAETLESVCGKEIARVASRVSGKKLNSTMLANAFACKYPGQFTKVDLGMSERISDSTFELIMEDGKKYICNIESGVAYKGIAPRVSLIHANIYKNSDAKFVAPLVSKDVAALSYAVSKLAPYLDDFDQIAGYGVKVCNWAPTSYRTDAIAIGKASKGQNAVVVRGIGALCTANSRYDLEAVKLVLEKECKTQMYSKLVVTGEPLAMLDNILMRTIYLLKYSKQANK